MICLIFHALLEVCLAGSADGIKDDLNTFAKAKGYKAWDEV
ncbi:hypothetical protein [Campylobacter magnus]|nr:hypothetical protein [Campylobacter magnus]MDO2407362.1 hypothetical protein [Campylobacter magnus]